MSALAAWGLAAGIVLMICGIVLLIVQFAWWLDAPQESSRPLTEDERLWDRQVRRR